MKNLIVSSSIFILLFILSSCGEQGSYYEQFTNDTSFTSRISDLNRTIDEIRLTEKGKLINDDINLLKYAYEIGKNDSYIVSYLFDEKGCYEIGIDGYFEMEGDANDVVTGIKSEMKQKQSGYSEATKDNNLSRWKNENGSISIELDYENTSRGLFIVTIFANE